MKNYSEIFFKSKFLVSGIKRIKSGTIRNMKRQEMIAINWIPNIGNRGATIRDLKIPNANITNVWSPFPKPLTSVGTSSKEINVASVQIPPLAPIAIIFKAITIINRSVKLGI